MKLIAIGASSSSSSINQRFASHAAHQVGGAEVTEFSLRDLALPVYSEDEEKENGIPADARRFLDALRDHDGIVVSLAEHNGSYTAAFKNLYDWASRAEQSVWQGKPMLLLSSSPGARGGAAVMEAAKATFPRMGARLEASFSLPQFHENFSESGINDPALSSRFLEAVTSFADSL